MRLRGKKIELIDIDYGNGLSISYNIKRLLFRKQLRRLYLTKKELIKVLWVTGYIDTYSMDNNTVCIPLPTSLPGMFNYSWININKFLIENMDAIMVTRILIEFSNNSLFNQIDKAMVTQTYS